MSLLVTAELKCPYCLVASCEPDNCLSHAYPGTAARTEPVLPLPPKHKELSEGRKGHLFVFWLRLLLF